MKPPLVILVGGKGTRLREVTGPDIPKPMVDVHGKPFLYWLIKHYIDQGFKDIILSVGYRAEVIEQYPWPTSGRITIVNDYTSKSFPWTSIDPASFYLRGSKRWIVNGDTFIPDPLPDTTDTTILSCNDIDAGAQYMALGKIKIHPVDVFYDIGTPGGLERFREYAKTQILPKWQETRLR